LEIENFTENKTSRTELDDREVRFAGLKIKNSYARATAKIRDKLKQKSDAVVASKGAYGRYSDYCS